MATMDTGTYDPQNVADDAFDRANHTGTQPISSVTDLQSTLDDKIDGVGTNLVTVSSTAPSSPNVGDIWVDDSDELGDLAFKDVLDPDDLQSGIAQDYYSSSDTTIGSGWVDLTTAGPSVTVAVPASGKVVVEGSAKVSLNSTVAEILIGFEATGANSISPTTNACASWQPLTHSAASTINFRVLLTGLTPGSTTFTLKYQRTGATGTFSRRRIIVEPKG